MGVLESRDPCPPCRQYCIYPAPYAEIIAWISFEYPQFDALLIIASLPALVSQLPLYLAISPLAPAGIPFAPGRGERLPSA